MYELQPVQPRRSRQPGTPPASRSRFWRGFAGGALLFVMLAVLGAGALLIGYAAMARDLPSPSELRQRASTFQTHAHLRPRGQSAQRDLRSRRRPAHRRVAGHAFRPICNRRPSPRGCQLLRAPGRRPGGADRARSTTPFQEGDVVSGGSTIPQQLVKMVLLSPERTLTRKIKEAILSAEISRRYTKDEILETLSERGLLRQSLPTASTPRPRPTSARMPAN